jgi:hypothetical protein
MYGAENLVEAEAMFHCQHEFRQQIAGSLSNNGYAQYLILTRHSQYLDKTVRRLVGNGPVQVLQAVAGHLEPNATRVRFSLGQSDTGNFRVGKGRPGYYGIVHLETFHAAE